METGLRILLSRSAFDRAADDIAALAPGAAFVTLEKDGRFRGGGRDLPIALVDPDIAWASADLFHDGLFHRFLETLAQVSRTQWCQLANAGLDNPVFGELMAKGMRLTKANGQAASIAEYVLAHALSLIVPLAAQREAQLRGEWRKVPFREIGQTRWAIVGFGSIGTEIAKRLRPFGAHITAVRRAATPDALADDVIGLDDLHTVLPVSDVVVLACPLNPATRGLADRRFFSAMKAGAALINVGRGAVLDEAALREGLDRDRPAHAVLDVFPTEPLAAGHWMWRHPKVRVTAHTSSDGLGTMARQDAFFLANLRRYLAGEKLVNEAAPHEVAP